MKVYELLKKYLGNDLIIESKLLDLLNSMTENVHFTKGQKIIHEGAYHPYAYFILEGCSCSYHSQNPEVVTWFAVENEWTASFDNYLGKASNESVKFMEDSTCLRFDIKGWKKLQETEKTVAIFFLRIMEEYIEFIEKHARNLAHREGIDRYQYLMTENPEYINRIPIKYLASYLGMSRENLSRLRRKIAL